MSSPLHPPSDRASDIMAADAFNSPGTTSTNCTHLWLLAILIAFGITIVLDTLDLFLWICLGAGLGVTSINWWPAVMRMLLLGTVLGAAGYFYKRAALFSEANQSLIKDLDSQSGLLAEKNSQLSRLKHLSEELISQEDLKPALDLALEIATDVIGARTASIMLLDPAGKELTIAAARGLSDEIAGNVRVKVGERLVGLVAKEGKAIIVDSDDLDERLAPLAQRIHEIKSAIIAPIKVDGNVRGIINVADKRCVDRWDEEDLAVVSTLAGQAAMVLQKIELYANLQEQVAMLRDALQELQKTQAGLIQSEKLASIGQLAGGVAHEINNPLFVILGRTEFALERISAHDPVARDLEVIRTQTERIAEIVRNLLSFSRASKIDDFRSVAVNDVVERTLALVESQMSKRDITVIRKLGDGLPDVWGNPGQLQQVFVNIVINAYQAMSESGGTLMVQTQVENGVMVVRFIDTGPGIAIEDRDRIFEPFFTTKEECEGTGLGLAISRGIIHTHGGRIEASGDPGSGAVFTIELPLAGPAELLQGDQSNEDEEKEKHNGCGRRERNTRVVS